MCREARTELVEAINSMIPNEYWSIVYVPSDLCLRVLLFCLVTWEEVIEDGLVKDDRLAEDNDNLLF